MIPTRLLLALALPLATLPACTEKDDTGDSQDADADTDADADLVELAYDDGYPEGQSSPWGTNGTAAEAVQFTPAGPAQIVGLAFYVGDQGIPTTPFDAEVWSWDADLDSPGDELLSVVEVTPEGGNQWVEVDLSADPVQTDGDFLVAMGFTTPPGDTGENSLFLAWDESEPDGRSYIRARGSWGLIQFMYGFPADFLIRATVWQ